MYCIPKREIKHHGIFKGEVSKLGDELTVDDIRDIERLTRTINNILANPKNWIVSEIMKENYDVMKVELKPLDTSAYCKSVFEKCFKTLIMSATILNHKAFCRSVGLSSDDVKFIQVYCESYYGLIGYRLVESSADLTTLQRYKNIFHHVSITY